MGLNRFHGANLVQMWMCVTFQKIGTSLKGKNTLREGANYFLKEQSPCGIENTSSTLGDYLNISNFHYARAQLRNGSYAIGPLLVFLWLFLWRSKI